MLDEGLTPSALATSAGVHATSVYKYLKGTQEPTSSTVQSLAEAVHRDVAHLLGGQTGLRVGEPAESKADRALADAFQGLPGRVRNALLDLATEARRSPQRRALIVQLALALQEDRASSRAGKDTHLRGGKEESAGSGKR